MLADKHVMGADKTNTRSIETNAELAAQLRLAIGKLSRQLRVTVSADGLTPTGMSVLFTVVRTGPVRLSDLAADEGLNPTMLSRVIAVLAHRGLVIRSVDPDDRRAVVVEATAAGRRLRAKVRRERSDVLAARMRDFSDEDRQALAAALPLLERLAAELKDGHR